MAGTYGSSYALDMWQCQWQSDLNGRLWQCSGQKKLVKNAKSPNFPMIGDAAGHEEKRSQPQAHDAGPKKPRPSANRQFLHGNDCRSLPQTGGAHAKSIAAWSRRQREGAPAGADAGPSSVQTPGRASPVPRLVGAPVLLTGPVPRWELRHSRHVRLTTGRRRAKR